MFRKTIYSTGLKNSRKTPKISSKPKVTSGGRKTGGAKDIKRAPLDFTRYIFTLRLLANLIKSDYFKPQNSKPPAGQQAWTVQNVLYMLDNLEKCAGSIDVLDEQFHKRLLPLLDTLALAPLDTYSVVPPDLRIVVEKAGELTPIFHARIEARERAARNPVVRVTHGKEN